MHFSGFFTYNYQAKYAEFDQMETNKIILPKNLQKEMLKFFLLHTKKKNKDKQAPKKEGC